MAERRSAALILLALGATGCTEPFARLLDFVCRESVPNGQQPVPAVGVTTGFGTTAEPNCETAGDVTETTGLTSDSLAFHFGPGGGSLAIRMAAVPAAREPMFSLEVLAASSIGASTLTRELTWGSCGASCPPDPARAEAALDDSFVWVSLVKPTTGTQGEPIPIDAVLTLSGVELDIVDLRTPNAVGPATSSSTGGFVE